MRWQESMLRSSSPVSILCTLGSSSPPRSRCSQLVAYPPSLAPHHSVGTVLCPPHQLVPVVSSFTAQIMVFDLKYPITAGYAVELFHHSRDIPATISSLDAVLDKTSGAVIKKSPRCALLSSSRRSPSPALTHLAPNEQHDHERFFCADSRPAPTACFGWWCAAVDHPLGELCQQQEYGQGFVSSGRGDDW